MHPIILLLLLAIPVACIAWTVTHEEIFREFREFATQKSISGKTLFTRKLFYGLTCEYCFSHYVAILIGLGTGYTLLIPDWRGVILGIFALVWIANVYMSLFGKIRMDIKTEGLEAKVMEKEL